MSILYICLSLILSAMIVNAINYAAYARKRANTIKELTVSLEEEMVRQFNNAIVQVTAEKHDGVIFFYESNTKQYLCRGKDKAELTAAVEAQFPGKMMIVDDRCDPEILAELGIQ